MANLMRKNDPFGIDRFFDDFFGGSTTRQFVPSLELSESGGEYVMRAELPGLDEKDVALEVDEQNILTIRGEKKSDVTGEEKGYRYSERSYGQFVRSVQLPSAVDTSKIDASFKNGVLELHIPKSEKAKPKTIPIGKKGEPRLEPKGKT